jgi:hypothetical protein
MALPTFVTVAEIAEAAHCTDQPVLRAIHKKDLDATYVAGKWLVTEEAALAWIGRRQNVAPLHEVDALQAAG